MTEGQRARLRCTARPSYSGRGRMSLIWTKANGESVDLGDSEFGWSPPQRYGMNEFYLIPTAEHHNTTITCVVKYRYDVIQTSVTMTVKCKQQHCLHD